MSSEKSCSVLTERPTSIGIVDNNEQSPRGVNTALSTINGNNLAIIGDLTRRALPCDLPGVERSSCASSLPMTQVLEEEKMGPPKNLSPRNMAALESLRNALTSDNRGEHCDGKAPRIKARSAPGKRLDIDMQPIDAVRLLSAFGTAEPGFASLMLSGVINAACDKGPAHVPGSGDINDALAAVTGIGARDETEGMPQP